jgi:phosphoribosylaminoimidazole (AIR) synthetase
VDTQEFTSKEDSMIKNSQIYQKALEALGRAYDIKAVKFTCGLQVVEIMEELAKQKAWAELDEELEHKPIEAMEA